MSAVLSRRKMQFAAIGAASTGVSYGSLFLLVDLWHVDAVVAYLVQAALAIEANYVLNAKFTWRDRETPGLRTWWRFHLTRVAMAAVNQLLFTGLVWAGVHYLVANTICIAATTVANYLLSDRFVFVEREPGGSCHEPPTSWQPRVSVIVPVKNSDATVRPMVRSLLAQDYQGELEIILVGDVGDTTWAVLEPELRRGAVIAYEADVRTPQRDANAKRHIGLRHATGEVLALTDSDMRLPRTWVRTVVEMLTGKDNAVAGSMISVARGFWGRYVDQNPWCGKTPRMSHGYHLTSANFGRGRHKPPVTANFACTRQVYERVGGPPAEFSYCYEDYPWFRRIVDAGYRIRCDDRLAAQHIHRSGFKALMGEYRRSGWGCADYLAMYPGCRLARKRLVQLASVLFAAALGIAAVLWSPLGVLGLILAVCVASAVRCRWGGAIAYPVCTAVLGMSFAVGMMARLATQGLRAPAPVTVAGVSRRGEYVAT